MATSATTYQAIVDIANFISSYAVTLAAVGALTMALLEAYKKLFSVLGRFQQKALMQWLIQNGDQGGKRRHYAVPEAARVAQKDEQQAYQWLQAYSELLHLTTGLRQDPVHAAQATFSRSVSAALFELDLAKMMRQVQEAADAALNNPSQYPALFAFLTRGCERNDVERWGESLTGASRRETNPDSPPLETRELADIYGRLRLLVRRQLDSFQTVTAFRWREINQLWAIILGALLLFLAQALQFVTAASGDFSLWSFGKILVSSLLGGMLAPVAKDLVDGLARVKSGG
jgi:hypothetical protein